MGRGSGARVWLLDAKVTRETYGQLAVWFGRLPGQPRARQPRVVFVSAGVAASLASLFGPPRGEPQCVHLDAPALTVFETPSGTPYHYDLFGGRDVGHTLMLGATGAGKSFTLNYLLVQALQYNPRVLILDLGGSYRALTQFLGGGYLEVSPEQDAIPLRPFALAPTERTIQFLSAWVLRLLKIGGWEPQSGDLSEVRARIEDLYALPRPRRALGNLVRSLPRAMWPALSRWHGTGAWGRWFDHPPADEADLKLSDWQVIDLAGAVEHEDWCEAALLYLLERLRTEIEAPGELARLKLMVVDEAWRYLRDPTVLTRLVEAAKTWRKRNAALIVATQSVTDLTATPGAATLLESMPTRLFLANPGLPGGGGRGRSASPMTSSARSGTGAEAGAVLAAVALGRGPAAGRRSGELLALHVLGDRRGATGGGSRAVRRRGRDRAAGGGAGCRAGRGGGGLTTRGADVRTGANGVRVRRGAGGVRQRGGAGDPHGDGYGGTDSRADPGPAHDHGGPAADGDDRGCGGRRCGVLGRVGRGERGVRETAGRQRGVECDVRRRERPGVGAAGVGVGRRGSRSGRVHRSAGTEAGDARAGGAAGVRGGRGTGRAAGGVGGRAGGAAGG